ncbi:hypothetical protein DPEC_G00212700 [Dallia pectoralis]|uniref:Uncharacterized protein n=1 Tax=Dallia pectoralis TaxID=75939 RepID=A0ACC2G6F1_DALPE|nr:hypothetical protein DPEC_G00212700 [Dallia pectoralis]
MMSHCGTRNQFWILFNSEGLLREMIYRFSSYYLIVSSTVTSAQSAVRFYCILPRSHSVLHACGHSKKRWTAL